MSNTAPFNCHVMTEAKPKSTKVAGGPRPSHPTTIKDSIMAMKYDMPRPATSVYPLDDKLSKKTYPDYCPWEDGEDLSQKLENLGYLNKGFFESSKVSNEYYSARNLIQETLFSSSQNCNKILRELSQHLTSSYKARDDSINTIRACSYAFRLPPRVTLTALKKDAWLKDLADPNVPLHIVSAKIPHGIRNKVLVDAMCSRNIPIPRAIWFTKCTLYSEIILMKKKSHVKNNSGSQSGIGQSVCSLQIIERRWLREWTQQVADYMLKFSREIGALTSHEAKTLYKERMDYLIAYVLAVYIEDLVDKPYFLSLVLRLLKEDHHVGSIKVSDLFELVKCEPEEEEDTVLRSLGGQSYDVGQILLALSLVKIFWKDIMLEDFLCKHLADALLLNYLIISKLPVNSKRVSRICVLSSQVKSESLSFIRGMIVELFLKKSDSFIIPSSWTVLGDVLLSIIRDSDVYSDETQRDVLERALVLMDFRNESLVVHSHDLCGERTTVTDMTQEAELSIERQYALFNRSSDDVLKLVEQLDRHKFKHTFPFSLLPSLSECRSSDGRNIRLYAVISWCVSSFRDMGLAKERILIVCNSIKAIITQQKGKNSTSIRNSLENDILECIFNLVEIPPTQLRFKNLYVLFNELYQLKVITISAYLRKLIASGIFYLSPKTSNLNEAEEVNEHAKLHLLLLKNLPVLNNRQCDRILKKWTENDLNFSEIFSNTTRMLREDNLDKILKNECEEFQHILRHIEGLSTGLQFLVINWFTSELKAFISKSSRLVHISPPIIARLYTLYASTCNLTAFFKVFVRFLLKNENKIIIFYMDTLYLLGKLILRHTGLLESLADGSVCATSTFSEILSLFLQAYKDLLSRESDMFDFRPLWILICRRLQRTPEQQHFQSSDPIKKGSYVYGFDQRATSMTLKSPVNDEDIHSADLTLHEVEMLASRDLMPLKEIELGDIVAEIKEECSCVVEIMKMNLLNAKVRALLELASFGPHEVSQLHLYKLLEHLRRLTLKSDPELVTHEFVKVLKDVLELKCEKRVSSLMTFVIAFEIVTIHSLFQLLDGFDSDILTLNVPQAKKIILLKLTSLDLGDYLLSVLLSLAFFEFKTKHHAILLKFIIDEHSRSKELSFIEEDSVYDLIVLEPKRTVDYMCGRLGKEKSCVILSTLLKVSPPVITIDDIGRLSDKINEFNLPMVQGMLSLLTSKDCDLKAVLDLIIKGSKSYLTVDNSYFGELFNLCHWNVRLEIFKQMENIFFNHLLSSMSSSSNIVYDARLSMVNDFFKKFRINSQEKIETSAAHFDELLKCLKYIVQKVDCSGKTTDKMGELLGEISTYLRIVIIRIETLTEVMLNSYSNSFEFLTLLVSLLNSEVISTTDERLRILLYDLLHTLRTSFMQQFMFRDNDDEVLNNAPSDNQVKLSKVSRTAPSIATDKVEQNDVKEKLAKAFAVLDIRDPVVVKHVGPEESFRYYADCASTLDEDELRSDGDVNILNQKNLFLCSKGHPSAFDSPFGEMHRHNVVRLPFAIKSFQLIENTGVGINDGCVNLALFRAYTTKENEP